MEFPVYIGIGAYKIHPHFLFEALGYTVALRLLLKNTRKDSIGFSQRSSVILGGMIGALLGAKLLVVLQHINMLWQTPQQWLLLILQGKTVVGALLGAWIGVEITKQKIGLKASTGDAFVYPLLTGMAIGRVGCFLTGLSDKTYGVATRLPWGVDFGDGVLRHPTQLYEIVFLIGLGGILWWVSRVTYRSGQLFLGFMLAYLGFRFGIDFLKPDFHPFGGISVIQLACLLGMGYCLRQLGLSLYHHRSHPPSS
jgi:phosphatidylglycerol---prolipoprotein diacylglyceryl transferase